MKLLILTVLCLASACAENDERPNIIIFISDDVSWNDHGCYGNKAARTPNIDQLAKHGIRFDNAYLTASSCSPSRSSIITGRYPHNNGKAAELHQPISWNLPWFPSLLRESGYYTLLSGKHHMSSTKPPAGQKSQRDLAFDKVTGGGGKGNNGGHANWVKTVKERPMEKPFFFWFASTDAHRGWGADGQWKEEYGPIHTPEEVVVPPFLVDDAATRKDLASYYNEVTRFDYFIGQVVNEIKSQGVLENTLLFVLSDNGRPFPRAKTRLHDSGMKTALVAHWPKGISKPGIARGMVSVIDLAPTCLEIAGLKAPETFQGVSMSPMFKDTSATIRRYAFSEHNWHDYEAHGRSIRSDGFLYLKNNRPQLPLQGPADSVRSPSFRSLLEARDANKLTDAQKDVFLAPRLEEELYKVGDDPHQLKNLAGNPEYAEVKNRLAKVLAQWSEETADSVPVQISKDSFHRDKGTRLKNVTYRFTTPGEDLGADKVNHPGPR